MRIILLFLLGVLGLVHCVKGQHNINGVYCGEFITSKNVLVINVKDTLVIGSFYLDQFEKLIFQGFFNQNILKGFFLQNGQPQIIAGKFKNDSLILDLVRINDGVISKHGTLAKISSNSKYNVNKIFTKEKPEHDSRLFGGWLIIKSVNSEGKDFAKEKYLEEFNANGFVSFSGPKFEKIFTDSKASNAILPSLSWETKAGKIIIKSHTTSGSTQYATPEEFIHYYQFSGDTLIIENPKTKEYFVKKIK